MSSPSQPHLCVRTRRRPRCRSWAACIVAALLIAQLAGAQSDGAGDAQEEWEPETIDLAPDDPVGWGLRNVFAPVTGLFMGGPGYWYGKRVVEVDSTPPGALVDLFYVRSNFQKRYEQAETPVFVVLPRRIDAGPRDALTVRVLLEGYRQESLTIRVSSRKDRLHLELAPLPNTLVSVAHRYFAGRASLRFLTKEALTFRLQEARDGFSVILTETGRSAEAAATLDALKSPMIDRVQSRQLGEDLVVTVEVNEELASSEWEPRSRQGYDPARDLHEFGLDLVPADGGAVAIAAAKAALGQIRTADVIGCALDFESALREGLDPAQLSRALSPNGQFTDPYFRAAMRRLGEVTPGGVVVFADGSEFRPSVPIELEVAMTQAAGARGYLALLRRFVEQLETEEHRLEVYRGLVAPELDTSRFDALVGQAEARQAVCLEKG